MRYRCCGMLVTWTGEGDKRGAKGWDGCLRGRRDSRGAGVQSGPLRGGGSLGGITDVGGSRGDGGLDKVGGPGSGAGNGGLHGGSGSPDAEEADAVIVGVGGRESLGERVAAAAIVGGRGGERRSEGGTSQEGGAEDGLDLHFGFCFFWGSGLDKRVSRRLRDWGSGKDWKRKKTVAVTIESEREG